MLTIIAQIVSYLGVAYVGYLFGKSRQNKERDKDFDECFQYGLFWKNTATKQAHEIERIRNRLEYFSVGELPDLYDAIQEEGFEDEYPILGIVGPIAECNIDFFERGNND